MKHVIRVLGIPIFSYEGVITESDRYLIDNTGGDFSFGPSADEYDDEEYEYSPDDPEGFGFRTGGLE